MMEKGGNKRREAEIKGRQAEVKMEKDHTRRENTTIL
jgi:hypothetical protein